VPGGPSPLLPTDNASMPSSVAVSGAVFAPTTYPRLKNCVRMLTNVCLEHKQDVIL